MTTDANADIEVHPLKDESVGGDDGGDHGDKSVLQAKLTTLAVQIGYGGFVVSLITVIVLILIFLIHGKVFIFIQWLTI